MKKLLSLVIITVIIASLCGFVSAEYSNYNVKFEGYTPDNVGHLTYLQWQHDVIVDGEQIQLRKDINVKSLESSITVNGFNFLTENSPTSKVVG